MDTIDWTKITAHEQEAFERRVALVETWLDDSIDEAERRALLRTYQQDHGVCDRTLRNYIKRYKDQGPKGLWFYRNTRQSSQRIPHEGLQNKILELVEERPSRTVPKLRRILSTDEQWAPLIQSVSDRTVYRFLSEQGLTQKARMAKRMHQGRKSFHRFEASCALELVQGDARDGIWLPSSGNDSIMKKTYLFAWLDDYSRKILHAQYFWDEKLPRMEDTFKTMVLRWGIPQKVYLDNGSVYIAAQFSFVLTELNVKKIHHGPYQSWCKGKVESVMKTIKQDFQADAQQAGFQTLEELNSALWAWIDVEYNQRVHSSTGQRPEDRFLGGLPEDHRRIEDLQWFENLFLQRETRTVTKYGEIKLEGNQYKTNARHGTVVDVRFDPFDLTKIWRFEKGLAVETLGVRKLVNHHVKKSVEEQQEPQQKVSQDAARYFAKLRENQKQLYQNQSGNLQFSRLKTQEVKK